MSELLRSNVCLLFPLEFKDTFCTKSESLCIFLGWRVSSLCCWESRQYLPFSTLLPVFVFIGIYCSNLKLKDSFLCGRLSSRVETCFPLHSSYYLASAIAPILTFIDIFILLIDTSPFLSKFCLSIPKPWCKFAAFCFFFYHFKGDCLIPELFQMISW